MFQGDPSGSLKSKRAATYRRLPSSGLTLHMSPLRPSESLDSILGTLAGVCPVVGACGVGSGSLGASGWVLPGSVAASSEGCPGVCS